MADHAADAAIAVDEFAQTRGADDLFDDEIIPITGQQEVQQVDDTPAEPEQPTETTPQQPAPTTTYHRGRGRGNAPADGGRGRGRGRGRGGRGRGDAGPKREHVPKEDTTQAEVNDAGSSTSEKQVEQGDESEGKTEAKAESARVQAVRGDRSGTGGVRKPKLTEEELAERMAAAKLNAAKKAAAHARAEADEASFQERERVASVKRRQELVNRKAMDNERERNRMRKLGAQTGREWDAEKKEEDYNGRRGGGSQYRRGMHGAVSGVPRREHSDSPEPFDELPTGPRDRGRGRGGRGRGRGGRGGRGDSSSVNDRAAPQSAPGISNESEFPSLPGNASKEATPANNGDKAQSPAIERVLSPDTSLSPIEGSWAEQVETSEAQ